MLFVLDHTLPDARYIRSLFTIVISFVNCFWFLSTNISEIVYPSDSSSMSRLVSRFVVYLSSLHLVCYSIFKVRPAFASLGNSGEPLFLNLQLVENKGLEPLTPCVQGRCSPS